MVWFDKKKENYKDKNSARTQRRITLKRKVPFDAIYFAYPYFHRLDHRFYTADLISDILSNGDSCRFYQELVKKKEYFNDIDAYISGSIDKGLFIITGKPSNKISIEDAEKEILNEINKLKTKYVEQAELQKVKNKIESVKVFERTNILHKAMLLAYYELLGDADILNHEIEKYNAVTKEDIKKVANEIFNDNNSNIIYYLSDKKK